VDWDQNYAILTINPETLAIEDKLILRRRGLSLRCASAGIRARCFRWIFTAARSTNSKPRAPEVKREITGVPLSSRNVMCDPVRDKIYVAGYADGMLSVIDYKTGATDASFCVGPKPSSMALLAARGELFIGSGAGVLMVKLDELLKSKR